MPLPRKVYVENLGCAKNQVDAEIMISALAGKGVEIVDSPDDADTVIVNSCGFIAPAKEESINTTIDFRSAYPDARIVLAGCLAQRYGGELADDFTEVDAVFGNRAPAQIVSLFDAMDRGERLWRPSVATGPSPTRAKLLGFPGSAYLRVSEGCNHACSFCAIPAIRGSLRSRSVVELRAEVAELVNRGIWEVNLVAQDLTAFGTDRGEAELVSLLRALLSIDGDFALRLLYLHPDTFPETLLPLFREDPRLLPYFDIPVQHASASVLREMGRTGNSDAYLRLIDRIRDATPDAVLRTTFLVGFPGETEDDLKQLDRFQAAAEFEWMGVFVYSHEEGTPIARRADEPDGAAMKRAEEWKALLEERQVPITERRLKRFVGREVPVLVEERVSDGPAIGRCFVQAPDVDGATVVVGSAGPGEVIRCRIDALRGFDFEARPVQ